MTDFLITVNKVSPGTLTSAIRGHFKTRHSTVSKIGYDSSF